MSLRALTRVRDLVTALERLSSLPLDSFDFGDSLSVEVGGGLTSLPLDGFEKFQKGVFVRVRVCPYGPLRGSGTW